MPATDNIVPLKEAFEEKIALVSKHIYCDSIQVYWQEVFVRSDLDDLMVCVSRKLFHFFVISFRGPLVFSSLHLEPQQWSMF